MFNFPLKKLLKGFH